MMDCKKAQRLFDDLAHERLASGLATEVRQHLADCTDCRVQEQRLARLQRLLALKRYERPAPQYFENFLTEFHSRLLSEMQPRPGWWERALGGIDEVLSAQSMRAWRYALAGAMSVTVALALMWMGLGPTGESTGDPMATINPPLMGTQISLAGLPFTPVETSIPLTGLAHVVPADYELAMVVPPVTRAESTAPQYVLDRISITPANYDVPNVHF
jgi:hypothetical protein